MLTGSVYAFRGVLVPNNMLFNQQDGEELNYNFADLTDSCEMKTNIDLNNTDYCSSPKREAFMSYTNHTNWSVLCCEFSDQCFQKDYSQTSEICANDPNGTYSGYLYNKDNLWLGYCCNDEGDKCYVDTKVDPNDESTLCDQEYTSNTMSLNWGTDWDAMCCAGGID